ncbi:MAG: cytochrome c biogenesis protein CcdA [Chloroflexi bacterium]|nr:MAG: cytochrome c biogenesis protein CcdA [Chloroflexota bacterium]TME17780.1 MAG: cytochrome c biogenesis protein CcdA [Chloroflexota bacterium]
MHLEQITPPLAFAAGLVSFLSPCVLPLVPAYVAYLGGRAADVAAPARAEVAVTGVSFVAGLSIVFILVFYAFQTLLTPLRTIVVPLAGVVVLVMAFQVAGLLRIPLLMREWRLFDRAPSSGGPAGGLLLGIGFAAGWTPCIGPTLGAVLTSGALQGTTPSGLRLILFYCLGLGVPFLVVALAFDRLSPLLRSLNTHRRAIDLTSGALLAVMGLILLTNNLTWLTAGLSRVLPEWLQSAVTI